MMHRRDFLIRKIGLALAGAGLAGAARGLRAQEAGGAGVRRPDGGVLRIGLIELDTSHADTLAGQIAGIEGAELTAVINSGLVYGSGRTEKFVAEHGVKHVCDNPREMVPLVDIAFSIGVNWERHVPDAAPFILAGKPVFIDKPVVGTEADARKLIELATAHRTAIFGGSTSRYLESLQRFKKEFRVREDKVTLSVYGIVHSHGRDDMLDLMYYGIHGTEVMQELMGPGAVSVEYLDFHRKQHVIHVHYDDRPPCILHLGWAGRRLEIVLLTDSGLETLAPSGGEAYQTIISRMAGSIATGRADRPVSEQVEACRILIAAGRSRTLGRRVVLAELTERDGYSGERFGMEYARFRNLPREATRDWRGDER